MKFILLKKRPGSSGWFHLDLQTLFFIVNSTYKCCMIIFVLSFVPDGHIRNWLLGLCIPHWSLCDLSNALHPPLQARMDAVRTNRKVSPHGIFCCRNVLFLACSTFWRLWAVFESSYFYTFTLDHKGRNVSDFSHAGGAALWTGLNTLSLYVSAILAKAGIPEACWWNVPPEPLASWHLWLFESIANCWRDFQGI